MFWIAVKEDLHEGTPAHYRHFPRKVENEGRLFSTAMVWMTISLQSGNPLLHSSPRSQVRIKNEFIHFR